MTSLGITGSRPSYLFSISGTTASVSVVSFSAYEWISHHYTVTITFASLSDSDTFDGVIGNKGVLTVVDNRDGAAGDDRFFNGVISDVKYLGRCQQKHLYEAVLVPALWRLMSRKNCRIFQEMNVQDIVKQLLEEGGIKSDCYRFSLVNKERKRGFCVQYRESDLDFITRILAEEGIFYFFVHSEDKHLLVLGDHNGAHPLISGESTISFNSGGMVPEEPYISEFSFRRRLGPAAFNHSNFNFKKPSLDLAMRAGDGQGKLEVYDYPALHTSQEVGSKLAKVRMEELIAQQSEGHGQTSCCRFTSGHILSLTDHDTESLNTDYLIVNVIHSGSQPQSLEEDAVGGFSYDASFTVIPASTPFRPTTSVQKPTISGVQSAIVVGPRGKEIYTDEYGRIKVQFHWDREGQMDDKSSCWLRINQPWSGSRWGMIAIPRVGDEVMVAFLDGDPDRPIMVGNVNNADSPALYELPANQTQTGIRTQSTPNGGHDNFNELRFEDRKGSEHVYLQAEQDWNILVKNDKGQTVGHDETLVVNNDRKVNIGANHTEKVGATKTETVTINSLEKVGVAKEVFVGGAYTVAVLGGMGTAVELGQIEKVGLDKEISVGKHLRIEVGDSVEIVCGKSTLGMDKEGKITINGHQLEFSAAGQVQITGKDVDIN